MGRVQENIDQTRQIRSIRYPLIGAILLAVLIPTVVGTVLMAVRGNNAAETQAVNQLESVVTLKTDLIDLWLDELEYAMVTLSLDGDITYFAPTVISTTHTTTFVELAQSKIREALQNFLNRSGRFNNLYVFNLEGDTLATTDRDGVELNITWYREEGIRAREPRFTGRVDFAQAAAGPFIMPLTYDANRDSVLIGLFHPVRDENGETLLIVGGDPIMTPLTSIIAERTGLGQQGETFIIDNAHRLLTESIVPEQFRIGESAPGIDTSMAMDTSGEDRSQRYINYRGLDVIGVYQPLDRLGGTLVAEVDAAEATGAITEVVNTNILVAIAAVVITGVGGVWFANRRIITPLTRLTSTSAQIRNGYLNVQADIHSSDEFGLLADNFNAMTTHLTEIIDDERLTNERLKTIIGDYVSFVQRVADGDLTLHIDLDEIDMSRLQETAEDLYALGSNLNNMVDNLGAMALQFHEVSEAIVGTASEIQVAVMQQTSSAAEQDSAVTQTVATVEEVRITVQQTAERAQQVARTSQQSIEVSRMGQQAVTENVAGMTEIQSRVNSIAEAILGLSQRTQQIGEIIDTVNALADQSKLLALNASIEAARAGEEGRGFAVVAMEVRQLAEQSREATARVSNIIDEIRSTTNAAVMVTEQGSKGAAEGMSLVERAGSAIRELAAAIEEAAQAATQIAASTQQQTNGMDQLAAAMNQFKLASEQSADSAQQTENSIQTLINMADQLEQVAGRYRLRPDA